MPEVKDEDEGGQLAWIFRQSFAALKALGNAYGTAMRNKILTSVLLFVQLGVVVNFLGFLPSGVYDMLSTASAGLCLFWIYALLTDVGWFPPWR